MFANLLLLLSVLGILHAAYSTYEHLSHLKALGRPEGSLPPDVVVESFLALSLGILGAAVRAPELKEITWRSEMKRRAKDEWDPRLSFSLFAQRAGISIASSTSDADVKS